MNKTDMTKALIIEMRTIRKEIDLIREDLSNDKITESEYYKKQTRLFGMVDGIRHSARTINISNEMWNKHIMYF